MAKKRSNPFFSFLIFIFIILIVGSLVAGGILYSQNKLPHSLNSILRRGPTPVPLYQEKLVWIPYTNVSRGNVFSMEIPFYGNYCNDCQSNNKITDQSYSLSHIGGGHFTPSAKDSWIMTVGISPKDTTTAPLEEEHLMKTEGILPGAFYDELTAIPVGEKKVLYDQYTFERLKDMRIEETTFNIYKTTLYSAFIEKVTRKNLAVFQKDGYTYFISFEYNNNLYKDSFDHMMKTFKFSKRANFKNEDIMKQLEKLN